MTRPFHLQHFWAAAFYSLPLDLLVARRYEGTALADLPGMWSVAVLCTALAAILTEKESIATAVYHLPESNAAQTLRFNIRKRFSAGALKLVLVAGGLFAFVPLIIKLSARSLSIGILAGLLLLAASFKKWHSIGPGNRPLPAGSWSSLMDFSDRLHTLAIVLARAGCLLGAISVAVPTSGGSWVGAVPVILVAAIILWELRPAE